MPRKRRVLEDLTPDERSKLKVYRARKHTPEAQAEENAVRTAKRRDLPPPATPASAAGSALSEMPYESIFRAQLEALRREREQKNLISPTYRRVGVSTARQLVASRQSRSPIPRSTRLYDMRMPLVSASNGVLWKKNP